ncbi:hypothetical protein ANO11243_084670 [Dothideomycetidae sp. 11243]|nr:hypothetical protein ANO11243_084670 [fungal sp. No.11243]
MRHLGTKTADAGAGTVDGIVRVGERFLAAISNAQGPNRASDMVLSLLAPAEAELAILLSDLKREEAEESRSISLELRIACQVVAEDMLVRLRTTNASATGYTIQRNAACWNKASLAALADRLSWIRMETARTATTTAGNTSRALWTDGPNNLVPELSHSNDADDIQAGLDTESSGMSASAAEIQETLLNENKAEIIQEFFLDSLSFPSMHDREEQVSRAHAQTFEWFFKDDTLEPPCSDNPTATHEFIPWLKAIDNERIFWINGKAGSGKSTLMRLIAKHKQTSASLNEWAAGAPLIVIAFFFWTGGSVLQRSQTGLLRSLLHQLLDQRRDLIGWVFPELWLACQDTKKRVDMLMIWTQIDLSRGFLKALQLASRDSKICLFIDGLDEYDGHEGVVIRLVRDLVAVSSRVKACVSSRPWQAFERAFQNVPHIMLSDLTGIDMTRYTMDKLQGLTHLQSTVKQASAADMDKLTAAVLKQADGVFLWTSLALRVITGKADRSTTFDSLTQALLDLPSDLEDLFRHLLFDGRSKNHLQDQSQMLQILRARDEVCDFTGDDSVRSISLHQMFLAFDGSKYNLGVPIARCDLQATTNNCGSFAELLKDRCAELIVLAGREEGEARLGPRVKANEQQLTTSANRRLHYLHRTVRDFLVYSGVWQEIVGNQTSASFDPHISLLRSHVLRLRSPLQEPEQHRRLDEWWHDDIVPAMTHARLASMSQAPEQVTLLDRLDATLNWYWRKRGADPLDTWARHAFGSYEERNKHKTPFHDAFLSLAAKFGLAGYLDNKLESGDDFGYKAGIPLLSHALEFLVSRRRTVYPFSSPAVVRVLLKHNEKPNQSYPDLAKVNQTPWLLAIRYVREGQRRGWMQPFDIDPQGALRWTEILKLLLEYGADPDAVMAKDMWDPEITVLGVLEKVGEENYSAAVLDVASRLRTYGQKSLEN